MRQPNIIHIIADDFGWVDLSADSTNYGNGSNYYQTPNLEALASRGMSFTSAYTCQNCVPTRAALLTGQYAPRTGIHNVGASQSQWRRHAAGGPRGRRTHCQQRHHARRDAGRRRLRDRPLRQVPRCCQPRRRLHAAWLSTQHGSRQRREWNGAHGREFRRHLDFRRAGVRRLRPALHPELRQHVPGAVCQRQQPKHARRNGKAPGRRRDRCGHRVCRRPRRWSGSRSI